MKRALYYGDCALWPAVVIAVWWFTFSSARWFIGAGFGFVLFTLAEYWIHRALHRWFYHGTHEHHHLHPQDYVVLWYVPFLFVGFWLLMPAATFAGFTAGYCWFICSHHAMHQWRTKTQIASFVSHWHDLHHRSIRFNFGITQPFWDLVFGTYRAGPL